MSRMGDEGARRRQARRAARQFLEELPRENRLILMLAAHEGLSDAEIGAVLELDEATVAYAREALCDLLKIKLGLAGGQR